MKNRMIAIVLSLAIIFLFAGASSFAQEKMPKKEVKTEKPIEHKIEKKDTLKTAEVKSTETKKTETSMAPKETKKNVKETKHTKKHVSSTTHKDTKKDDSNKPK